MLLPFGLTVAIGLCVIGIGLPAAGLVTPREGEVLVAFGLLCLLPCVWPWLRRLHLSVQPAAAGGEERDRGEIDEEPEAGGPEP
jgi:hypothetical protein